MKELDVDRPDGGSLHVYDTGGAGLPVLWHHGTPNVGEPPRPLFNAAERLGLRWIGYDRPGYGGSSHEPDRPVSGAAGWATVVADALDLDRFSVFGHSGGGPHALACAALLPGRVVAAVAVSSLAPYDAAGLDYTAAMAAAGAATLEAAAAGRASKEEHERLHGQDYDPEFTEADVAALAGEWGWFGHVVGAAEASGPAPAIDDDLAYVRPWGFHPADVGVPTLLLHGARDRIAPIGHARWLAHTISGAELWERPDDGHISVMTSAVQTLEWLARR